MRRDSDITISDITIGALLLLAAVALCGGWAFGGRAAGTVRVVPVEPCPVGETCTIALGPGHWIIVTPKGQTITWSEIEDETRYRIETPRGE